MQLESISSHRTSHEIRTDVTKSLPSSATFDIECASFGRSRGFISYGHSMPVLMVRGILRERCCRADIWYRRLSLYSGVGRWLINVLMEKRDSNATVVHTSRNGCIYTCRTHYSHNNAVCCSSDISGHATSAHAFSSSLARWVHRKPIYREITSVCRSHSLWLCNPFEEYNQVLLLCRCL